MVKLKIGFLPNFLLAFANEVFLIVAILAGLASKSWIVFVVVLILPIAIYSWLFATYGSLVIYESEDA